MLATRGLRTHHFQFQRTFPSHSFLQSGIRARFRFSSSSVNAQCYSTGIKKSPARFLFKAAGVVGLGLSGSKLLPQIHCDAPTPLDQPVIPELPTPPTSTVSLYQLSFGTVAGVCAGIFIKKGAKAAAWLLGGIFVLLQYLGSASVIRVDWGSVASKYENMFYTPDASAGGSRRAPTVASIWTWLIDFLTADFQPRASFIVGLALGLRIG
ncbi:hypothetical protein Hypma_011512 [Hypsizygus marmoreus]|uniref:FUN14 domain-containing protein 1 n=1 Tax=Hypsizygus marmoreus TaxID=39966 RepID=A0A369JNL2_HYPMA|nr:hypothetical protein Hypma_011512 [Hypsizygus marmoreus]